ncbi:RAD50-interacting protein 1 [Desmophyllum pertusum]|uniref:RAD50-interacting protein 1 n=1 Tax=Desmophyllum pertusum TaxID=174260 RepID=A0A9W9ZZT2_9CNID|nr:RAD50-interacting protein 1 [Desmophyllum pertusum]
MKALKWPFTSLSTAPPLSTTSDDYSRLENVFILLLKLQQLRVEGKSMVGSMAVPIGGAKIALVSRRHVVALLMDVIYAIIYEPLCLMLLVLEVCRLTLAMCLVLDDGASSCMLFM